MLCLQSLQHFLSKAGNFPACPESQASEHSARMVAMKTATDNAGNLIDDLTLNITGQDRLQLLRKSSKFQLQVFQNKYF